MAWRGRQKTKNLTSEYIMTDLINMCDRKDESGNAGGKIMFIKDVQATVFRLYKYVRLYDKEKKKAARSKGY